MDLGRERRVLPRFFIAGRDNVGMTRKADVRRPLANAGVKIVHIGHSPLAETKAMGGEARGLELFFQIAERPAFFRRNAAAADQVLGVDECACHNGVWLMRAAGHTG